MYQTQLEYTYGEYRKMQRRVYEANIILQLIALGEIENIEKGRQIIAETEKVHKYEQKHTSDWDEAYIRFCEILKK